MTPRFINCVICNIGIFWVDQVWKREDTCGCFAYDKYWTTITFPTVYANKNGYKDSRDRTFVCIHLYIYMVKKFYSHWPTDSTRKWQPTPVFLPGEFQGWGSLVGCCLWGCTELDTTEVT